MRCFCKLHDTLFDSDDECPECADHDATREPEELCMAEKDTHSQVAGVARLGLDRHRAALESARERHEANREGSSP